MHLLRRVALLLLLCAMPYIVSGKKKTYPVLTADLAGIACDVCEVSIDTLHTIIAEKRAEAPYKKLEELVVQDTISQVCKTDTEVGEWIRYLDITEQERNTGEKQSVLINPGGVSKCQSECVTIARSCEMLYEDEIDGDDLSAILWKNKHSIERLKVSPIIPSYSRCVTHVIFSRIWYVRSGPSDAQRRRHHCRKRAARITRSCR